MRAEWRFHNLDLNLLSKLYALLEERSVSRAGERLFLSQSAMSDALARLREYFKDQLLVQVGKSMVPTALGESLMPRVGDVLMQIQALTSSSTSFNPATSTRKIRIMASDYAIRLLLGKVYNRVWQLAPNMQIEIVLLTSHFHEELHRRQLDMVIVPDIYVSDDEASELLFEDKYVCVACSENRLLGKELTIDSYFQLGHVCVNLGEWRVPTYDAFYAKRLGERERKVEAAVPLFGMIFQLIPGTNRIATVQHRNVAAFAPKHTLRILEPPFEIPPFREHLLWLKCRDDDPAIAWFRSVTKFVAAELH